MNTEKNKNQSPAKNTFQASAYPPAFSSTKANPKKSKSPLFTVFLGLLLAAAIVGGGMLFTLNRPGTEVHNAPTATRLPTSQAQNRTATANALTPRSTASLTPGSTEAPSGGTTVGATAAAGAGAPATPTLIVVNGQSMPQIQGYGVVTSKVLNLRSAPNTGATVVKSLKTGDIVELISRNGGWYQTNEGLWISASYMEVRQTRPEAESYARELAAS